ncbi:MAG: glycosyltransferase family 4 protein [Gammaproteobacteria bacterium]|nr:glycosyltransferase family 4 protein [Gammaproteobacteria bacterium]MDH5799252.1 glycosyltransferase family 4 protein [Gammaproteobacteria bacterium]
MVDKMNSGGILIALHFGSNIGYAIAPLEKTFYLMALELTGDASRIHFSYQNLDKGMPESLPQGFSNVITLKTRNASTEDLEFIKKYITEHDIKWVFGFDLPVSLPVYKPMRDAGVERIVSYYGAPLSSINRGMKLLLKRIEVGLRPHKPDHFILESIAMQNTAVFGRGIRAADTSVVNLGVDTDKYKPDNDLADYAYSEFSIPRDQKILFYSGHMQERKGVDVIIKAITHLVNTKKRSDVHMLLLGNKNDEEKRFYPIFENTPAQQHITFGGYRSDLHKLMASCYLGVIASNGWDSFPRSAIEMGASGLPLLVSNFQGLTETIVEGKTGYTFRTSDHVDLADKIIDLLDNNNVRDQFSQNARERAERQFTLDVQLNNLVEVMRKVIV